MLRANSIRCALSAAAILAAAACGNGDYCGERQTSYNILSAKFAPCLDGGFADSGFTESSCEDVLTGGNCSDGDRTALDTLGSAAVNCADANPVCSPETPLDALGLSLQFSNCVEDAGVPASSISLACTTALATVNAGY